MVRCGCQSRSRIESPVPGTPRLKKAPLGPMLMLVPLGPMVMLGPLRPRFNRTPGRSEKEFRKRIPIKAILSAS
jgi:hypothetical protein